MTFINHQTRGVIQSIHGNNVRSKQIAVHSPRKWLYFTQIKRSSSYEVLSPPIITENYMLTSHSVWDGSSGGIYATENGKIIESIVESPTSRNRIIGQFGLFPWERLNRETFHL